MAVFEAQRGIQESGNILVPHFPLKTIAQN
jgi:hypothetical protein